MSTGGQVVAAVTVLAAVAVSGVCLVLFVPELWWIFTTYFWVAFPAFRLLSRGLSDGRDGHWRRLDPAAPTLVPVVAPERELLDALGEYGEISVIRASVETSLTVAEADERLRELAESGHLEVRVRGGGLFYALWDTDSGPAEER